MSADAMRTGGLRGPGPRHCVLGILFCLNAVLGACRGVDPAPRHLVLITVDTLRSDHLGCYGSPLGLSPNVDALAESGELFTRAYAAAPFTLPSISALMSGRHPEEVDVTSNIASLAPEIPTLAERLADRGWRTGAVVSSFVLRGASGVSQGFDHFDASFPEKEGTRGAPERTAALTTDAAIAMTRTLHRPGQDPIFLWVHYQDPHGAYVPPAELRERHLAGERARPGGLVELDVLRSWSGMGGIPSYQYRRPHRTVAYYRAGYDGEISWMDRQVGRLLDFLEAEGVLDQAVVVFTSDHGEGLGEDGYWFAHGELLNEAAVRVPLVIRVPGRPPRQREEVVSLLDLLPTLAALFGLDVERDLRGEDLLAKGSGIEDRSIYVATVRERARAARRGLVRNGFKLVRTTTADAVEEQLFRLPDETVDLSSRLRDRAATMRAELDATVGSFPRTRSPGPPELSPGERESLRALGYSVE